jgi:hypothetical protein
MSLTKLSVSEEIFSYEHGSPSATLHEGDNTEANVQFIMEFLIAALRAGGIH